LLLVACLFLLGAALLGMGIVCRLGGKLLTRSEIAIWGLVVGWMLSTGVSYGLALAQHALHPQSQVWLVPVIWAIAGALWWPGLRQWRSWQPPSLTGDGAPLLLLAAYFTPVFIYLWATRMFQPRGTALFSGGAAWADMCLHLAISNAFLLAGNFPPVYTIFPPEPLRYPYLPDYLTALLMGWGLEAWQALTVTAVPVALACVWLLYGLTRRITGSRAASVLAPILFVYNGGVGFWYFFQDLGAHADAPWAFWTGLDVNYGRLWDQSIHWSNVLVDTWLPQRASLFGFAAGFIILTLFAMAWERWSEPADGSPWRQWPLLAAAGLLTGLLPLYHTFTYMAVGLISGFLFLLSPRRTWLVYWLPAVLLALPQLNGIASHAAGKGFMFYNPFWMAHWDNRGPLLYFLRNLGLPLLLIFPAWWAAAPRWRKFYLAFVMLLAVTMTISVSPHEYNNLKLMYYWYAVSCVLIAAWLVTLARVKGRRWTAFGLSVVSVLTGLLSGHAEAVLKWEIFSNADVQASVFVKHMTPPDALWLTGLNHNQPIASLTGRTIVLGYTGWIVSHGYDVTRREADVRAMYAGGPKAAALLAQYKVDYVYLGAWERQELKGNNAWYAATYPAVYDVDGLKIYEVVPHRSAMMPANPKMPGGAFGLIEGSTSR
jgi:hypothetical protein